MLGNKNIERNQTQMLEMKNSVHQIKIRWKAWQQVWWSRRNDIWVTNFQKYLRQENENLNAMFEFYEILSNDQTCVSVCSAEKEKASSFSKSMECSNGMPQLDILYRWSIRMMLPVAQVNETKRTRIGNRLLDEEHTWKFSSLKIAAGSWGREHCHIRDV